MLSVRENRHIQAGISVHRLMYLFIENAFAGNNLLMIAMHILHVSRSASPTALIVMTFNWENFSNVRNFNCNRFMHLYVYIYICLYFNFFFKCIHIFMYKYIFILRYMHKFPIYFQNNIIGIKS